MLRPHEFERVLAAARDRAKRRSLSGEAARPVLPRVAPGRTRGESPPARGQVRAKQSVQAPAGTGINPWWRYQEQNAPGGGHVMVNLGTGNMLLQQDDMSVPHKGVALAFRRTYNSQSGHDVAGTDGTPPGLYGNGWTNTFDAHLSGSRTGTMSVWDIDGARYDYTLAADGVTLVAPPGQHATLVSDGGYGYLWMKKSGTIYYFYAPDAATSWPSAVYQQLASYAGRLYEIIGRNRNTNIVFSYSWDNGNGGAGGKISTITAQPESGPPATLTFGDVGRDRLLSQIQFPDGATYVYYGYDAQGNLRWVSPPANNAAGSRPAHQYGYQTQGSGTVLWWTDTPRWDAGCASTCGSDGGFLAFQFTGSSPSTAAISTISHAAVVNPVISDTSGTAALQSGYPTGGLWWYLTEYYTTGAATPTFRDTDGHMTNWVVDSLGRPMQTQDCTASTNQGQQCTGQWLVTNESWDASNNLVSETDPRGYQTDYAYDANGNTVAVAEPSTAVRTSGGTVRFRPTKLFSYDTNNNVVAACDEAWSHRNGRDWDSTGNPGPSDALCPAIAGTPQQPGTTVIAMSYPSYQPAGQITSIANAMGFHHTLGYAAGPQQGQDYGLPTDVTDEAIPQRDGTSVQRHQSLAYDASGNLTSYNTGTGTWSLTYDALGRMTTSTDPDGFTSYHVYNPDGSVQRTETAAQHATNQGAAFDYDLDGNVAHETHHFACLPNQTCTPGVTTKWYDGADRLVEVQQPRDPSDFYNFPWTTRYLYDLTAGGTVGVAGRATYHAYGNLYKTQELLASTNPIWYEPGAGTSTGTSGATWMDLTGTETDALDRPLHQYRVGSNLFPTVTLAYDGNASALGQLSSKCNVLNECMSYSYDERAKLSTASSNLANTPARTYAYDEDARTATATSAIGSVADTYDGAGNLARRVQTGSAGAATLTYHYYPNATRSAVDIDAGAAGSGQNVLAYSYHADGRLGTLAFAYRSVATSWTFGYTNAGRLAQRSNSLTNTADTFAYDPSGHGKATAFSIGSTASETGLVYDAEGALSAVTLPGGPLTASFTSRGELKSGFGEELSSSPTRFVAYANGVRVVGAQTSDPNATPGASSTWDALLAAGVSGSLGTVCADSMLPCTPAPQTGFGNASLDAAGRLQPKTYDAEDHPVNQVINVPGPPPPPKSGGLTTTQRAQTRYTWGPNGHPFAIGSTSVAYGNKNTVRTPTDFADEALYWDGDQLLFTLGTTSAGFGIDNIKIANVGEYIDKPTAPASVAVWHRDAQDQNPGCYTSGDGSAFMDQGQACNEPSAVFPVAPHAGGMGGNKLVGHGAIVGTPRADGIYDGFNSIQGVRAFDTQAGIWSSPDAYVGDVHDPMSQKAYMWNGNNPYAYSDPSGYDWNELRHDAADLAYLIARSPHLGALMTYGIALSEPVSSPSADRWGARDHAVRSAAKGADAIIGKYPEYKMYADQLKLRKFDVPMDAWNKMGSEKQDALNMDWIAKGIKNGWTFVVVKDLSGQVDPNSSLAKEIKALLDAGYQSSSNGTVLSPPKKN